MKLGKLFISTLLLLVYSAGFTHNMLPHCHSNEDAKVHEHAHELDRHSKEQKDQHTDHKHIAHQNHFDDMFIDYLICLLSESNHVPLDHNEYFQESTTSNAVKNSFSVMYFILPFETNMPPSTEIVNISIQQEVFTLYQPPQINNSPHRGPPVNFC